MEYSAVISRIKVRPHPDADRIQIGNVCNVDVIVGLDTKEGDLGVYFAPDGQLSVEFAEANDLISRVDPGTLKKVGGYFGKNRRVKAQKFRGINSYGFWIPIESLDKLNNHPYKEDISLLLEGDTITHVDGVPVCNKYITPATLKVLKGQKGALRRQNNLFAKHSDTEHLRKNIQNIPVGSVLYITEKLHGTSGRTGYVLENKEIKQSIGDTILGGLKGLGFKRTRFTKEYTTVTGTRNVILKERTALGFYGNEEFRGLMEDRVSELLKKGEIIYYEIVGHTTTGKNIMHGVEVEDKSLKNTYGKTMSYTYGCKENQCEMYVYRITNVNEDGIAIDLSWPMVMTRCKELGIKHVPNLGWTHLVDVENGNEIILVGSGTRDTPQPILYEEKDSEFLLEIVDALAEGASGLDSSHIKEGVVIRVESGQGVKAYKEKSHTFLTLEGILKDKDDYVDMEEAA